MIISNIYHKVTLEINTDPPPLDLPKDSAKGSIKTTMNLSDLGNELNKLSTEFKIPPELLE
jgi:hypothetical protein